MNHIALTLITPPVEDATTLAAAKNWLRIDSGDESQDAVVSMLVRAARERYERVTMRALLTQTWSLKLDGFPYGTGGQPSWGGFGLWGASGVIRLPKPPTQSVTSIVYLDSGGATQTLSALLYQVDVASEPARLLPVYGQFWPVTQVERLNSVTVTFVCGCTGWATVPQELKQRLLLCIAYQYEHRTDADESFLDNLFTSLGYGEYV